jgi:hypothetical protein
VIYQYLLTGLASLSVGINMAMIGTEKTWSMPDESGIAYRQLGVVQEPGLLVRPKVGML